MLRKRQIKIANAKYANSARAREKRELSLANIEAVTNAHVRFARKPRNELWQTVEKKVSLEQSSVA